MKCCLNWMYDRIHDWWKRKNWILRKWILLGIGCMFTGVVITAIEMIFPHQFSTILEVDYDTPYDRHVIIEESFDTRNVRRRLPKIEDSFGDRIIRFYFNSCLLNYICWINQQQAWVWRFRTYYIDLEFLSFQSIVFQATK